MSIQISISNAIGSRDVVGSSVDPDAQAFITAAGITDAIQKTAINTLVVDLKGYNIWTKLFACYPLVGGTSATHKWNLKDPRDLDAAYRIVFNGGWTHASTGATPNGVNGWGDTKLVAQGTLSLNSTSFGVYSRTNLDRLAPSIGNVTGAATSEASLWLRYSGLSFIRVNGGTASTPVSLDSRGLFIANRVNSTQAQIQIRGTQTTFTNASQNLSTNVYQLGGVNPNFFDTKELAFAFIADGLTSQNMTDFNSAVVAFETTLSRNV